MTRSTQLPCVPFRLGLVAILVFILFDAKADPNLQRIGFTALQPTSYADWPNAFLSGNGKMGIMVLGDTLNEVVVFNDRGFNLSTGTVRSFDQVSTADLEKIRDDCAAGKFVEADHLAAAAPHYRDGGDGSRHPGYGIFITIPPDGTIQRYAGTCDFRTGEME